jgi:hypothetical protein
MARPRSVLIAAAVAVGRCRILPGQPCIDYRCWCIRSVGSFVHTNTCGR